MTWDEEENAVRQLCKEIGYRRVAQIAKDLYSRECVTPSCGCVFCDIKVARHEDVGGFHHVADGERISCGLNQQNGKTDG